LGGTPTAKGSACSKAEALRCVSGARASTREGIHAARCAKPRPGWGLPGRGFAADTALGERAEAPLRGVAEGIRCDAPFLLSLCSRTLLANARRTFGSAGAVWNRTVSRHRHRSRCSVAVLRAPIERSAFAQTAVIQEDEGRESVASTAQTSGIFGPLRVASPKLSQSAAVSRPGRCGRSGRGSRRLIV
jgi:hypothetical protein